MGFYQDRRGQSVVVGTVIVFGFLILALSLYQVQVVPMQNSDVEFDHSQQTEQEFLDLRNSVLNTATTGASRSTAVELGTRYPQRIVAINPPQPSGTIETTPERDIEIDAQIDSDNVSDPNIEAFWEIEDPQYQTRSIQYTPRYNELRNPPQLTYEHTLVTAAFNSAVLLRSDQTIVRNNRVTLPTLQGAISETDVQSKTIDSTVISQQTGTVPITGDGGPVEIRLPTAVADADEVASRLTIAGAQDVRADGDTIVIELEETSIYQLGLSAVSVDGSGQSEPQYLVPAGDLAGERTVTAGQRVGIEVRDKYNNPVSGAIVNVSGTEQTTNDNGRVFAEAETPDLTAQLPGAEQGYEQLEFNVTEGNDDGDAPRINPVNGTIVVDDVSGGPQDFDVTFRNDVGAERTITNLRISFYTADADEMDVTGDEIDDITIPIPSGFDEGDITDITLGDKETVTLNFDADIQGGNQGQGQGGNMKDSFMIASIRLDNGQTNRYFIAFSNN